MTAAHEGHLFVDEGALTHLADRYSHGPPSSWTLNEYGQPNWLLRLPWTQLYGSWGVIAPPAFPVSVPREIWTARGLDRQRQGLAPWGRGKLSVLSCLVELGPASMPAITWATPRPERRGHPGLSWIEPELSCYLAWLVDIRGWSRQAVVHRFFSHGDLDRNEGALRALRRKANRYLSAGRRALCDQGVWPWVSVPLEDIGSDLLGREGHLPELWWDDADVLAHLDLWYSVSATDPARRRAELADAIRLRSGAVAPWAWQLASPA
jgi:hypothetical protein